MLCCGVMCVVLRCCVVCAFVVLCDVCVVVLRFVCVDFYDLICFALM